MASKFLRRTGLQFHNPVMEKAYMDSKASIEGNLFFYVSVFLWLASVAQIPINFIIGFDFVLLDTILAATTTIGLACKKKLPVIYKLFFTFYPLVLLFILARAALKTDVEYPIVYNLVTGNVLGMGEILFLFALTKISTKILFACIAFAIKMIAIQENFHFDDSVIWCFSISLVFIVCSLYYDRMERRNFKIMYESSQKLEKFHILLSNDFPSHVVITNANFTSIVFSNQFFTKRFGPKEPVQNNPQKDFVSSLFKQFKLEPSLQSFKPVNKDETLFDLVHKIAEKEIQMEMNELMVISAALGLEEDTIQHYEIRMRKILWEGEVCYTLILDDISDKQRVMSLKYADEQKDRVIATVSHELRTPINGILGLLEMASLLVENTMVQTYLQHCKSCSKLLLYLVNSMLDLSQIRQNKLHIVKDTFKVDQLLEEMKSLYVFQTQQKGLKFIVEKASNVPEEIYTDKFRLIEILINLLSNALKFTFVGSITLSISVDNQDPSKLRISVADTGLGIKEEDKPKLFQMFGKLKQENKNVNSHGVGLGLSIANSLVKALNDDEEKEKIELETEYQKGSTFTFRVMMRKPLQDSLVPFSFLSEESRMQLGEIIDMQEFSSAEDRVYTKVEVMTKSSVSPIFSPHFLSPHSMIISHQNRSSELMKKSFFQRGMSTPPKRIRTKSQEPRPKNVLIVDDNCFNLLTASFLLEKFGLAVTKAISGEECIEILKKSVAENKRYDLILMDIQMPIQDGIETTKIITSKVKSGELYDIPILALTANKIGTDELKKYKEIGMSDAIEKPLQQESLCKILSVYFPSLKEFKN